MTLLMHGVVASWLLRPAGDRAAIEPVAADLVWVPMKAPPEPEIPPPPEPIPSLPLAPVPPPLVQSAPDEAESKAITLPDWEGDARDVASEFGRGAQVRRFGPEPEQEPRQLRSERPLHSVFERPLPRVGTAVRTPEGEQILWVSDNCYISLGSQSLTMGDFHKARNGVRRCQVGVGKRRARGDLFDPIKRPPKPDPLEMAQQEPGCGPGEGPRSCAP